MRSKLAEKRFIEFVDTALNLGGSGNQLFLSPPTIEMARSEWANFKQLESRIVACRNLSLQVFGLIIGPRGSLVALSPASVGVVQLTTSRTDNVARTSSMIVAELCFHSIILDLLAIIISLVL